MPVVFEGFNFGKTVSDFDSGGWHVVVQIPKVPGEKKPKVSKLLLLLATLPNANHPWAYSQTEA